MVDDNLTIAISYDALVLLPPFIPLTPEQAVYFSNGDSLTYSAIENFANTIKEALILTSIYQLGDAIMANVLKRYKHVTTGTGEEALIPAITLAEGERIDSLAAYNPTGGSITATVILNDGSADTVKFVQVVEAGKSVFIIGGFDKVNLAISDLVNVQSSTLGVFFYASNVIGVST